jgi:carbamoyl-phosphate synthase large subunit
MGNVLISSAGRRVSLVRAFQKELSDLGSEGRVFAIDAKPELSAACAVADKSEAAPALTDPSYTDFLCSFVRRHEIKLIVPTIDTELQLLSAARDHIRDAGAILAVSSPGFLDICRDKRRTQAFFQERGITTPREVPLDNDPFLPLYAKPIDGSSSKDNYLIATPEDLYRYRPLLESTPGMIYMEAVNREEWDEYTIDLYYDRDGRLRCAVPRVRLATRSGEVVNATTHRNDLVPLMFDTFGSIPGALGCITLQLFRHRDGGRYIGIEINARFGGGFPLSYAAGANYPGWLLREHLLGQKIATCNDWKAGLTMLRYDQEILVSPESKVSHEV